MPIRFLRYQIMKDKIDADFIYLEKNYSIEVDLFFYRTIMHETLILADSGGEVEEGVQDKLFSALEYRMHFLLPIFKMAATNPKINFIVNYNKSQKRRLLLTLTRWIPIRNGIIVPQNFPYENYILSLDGIKYNLKINIPIELKKGKTTPTAAEVKRIRKILIQEIFPLFADLE